MGMFLWASWVVSGCWVDEIIDHTLDMPSPTAPDLDPDVSSDHGGMLDQGQPIPVEGLAEELLIDGQVYQGTYEDGSPYEGRWGQAWRWRASDYPLSYRLAIVHQAKVLKQLGFYGSANLVAAFAIQSSGLSCGAEGCFLLNRVSAPKDLAQLYPERFASEAQAQAFLVGEFSQEAWAWSHMMWMASQMMARYHEDPDAFYQAHPDPMTKTKLALAALVTSPWWEGFGHVFSQCAQQPVESCMLRDGQGPYYFLIDHGRAILSFSAAMDGATPHDVAVSWGELEAYIRTLALAYTQAELEAALVAVGAAFERRQDATGHVSFARDVSALLDVLIWTLPQAPPAALMRSRLCAHYYIDDPARCMATP